MDSTAVAMAELVRLGWTVGDGDAGNSFAISLLFLHLISLFPSLLSSPFSIVLFFFFFLFC
jgi:hypothetical protein